MIDFENLSDREREAAMSRGYRFDVGSKDPESHYWIGFIYVPLKDIDPNTYQKVAGRVAELTWAPFEHDELDEFYSNPTSKILNDIELCTRAFHVDENGEKCIVDVLDARENNDIQYRVMTALRVAKIIPEFLTGSLSVGLSLLSGKVHPSLVLAGTWTPPQNRQ